MSKQPDGSFVLTAEEYGKLREAFLRRGRGIGEITVATIIEELCAMIERRTGREYEQLT